MFPSQGTPDGPGFADNEVLDEFTIPFGSWTEEAVDWTTLNLEWLLDGIKWPFEFLLSNLVDNFLLEIPWIVVVGIMFAIAWLVRNLTVAIGTAVGLTVCGLLGIEYWTQTARTIGFIAVAVVICVIIGIPMGILAGRIDSVWKVVRPTLDAMQVIHSFVYLLPFVYFWGVGRVSATMATMVFALPPLIRLTNLGIRQVPEDVVEASRAYGARELRVLTDVQLPLARPAIMTGINQTLLLAFSMLGVAAILGAGGLGQLLFRALGQQDVSLAASSGLAFFILAVVLDRIAQSQGGASTSLSSRIVGAWRARKQPEVLLDDPAFNPTIRAHVAAEEEKPHLEGRIKSITSDERPAIIGVIVGAGLMLVSVLLTWSKNAGLITGYSRRSDQELPGESFSGIAAEGGSWFGFTVAALALMAIAAAVTTLLRPANQSRWMSADGALIGAFGGFLTALAYFVAQPSDFTVGHEYGIGLYIAVIGGALASGAALRWAMIAPYAPRRPLKSSIAYAPIVLASIAVLFAVVAMFSSWTLDERQDVLITPEIQAELDEVVRAAEAGEIEPGVAATEIQTIRAQAVAEDAIVTDGKSSAGAGLGIWTLAFTLIGAAGALVAGGVAGIEDRRRWIGGAVAMAFGAGVTGLSIGWIGSLARATDANFQSGVGILIALLAGVIMVTAGQSIIGGFEREKDYVDTQAQEKAEVSGTSGAPRAAVAVDPVSSTIAP